MPNFKVINDPNEIILNNQWVPATKFNSKDKIVDYKGRQYQIIEKKERTFSCLERIGRSLLGVAVVVCTLSLGLFSKSVRNLFTKLKENVRYAVLLNDHSGKNSNITEVSSQQQPISPPIKSAEIDLDAKKAKIIEEFTPQMVEALGGVDKVLSFPILENWNGEISEEHLTAPVMICYHENGSPFLLFSYLKLTESGYQISGEYLGRRDENSWQGSHAYPGELNLRSPNPVLDGSPGEKYMLDKINRLMRGEAVGVVEKFSGVILSKPKDKNSYVPNNAYLKDEELYNYMDLETLYYEKMPPDGMTEVYLYDPRISKEENINGLKKKFPKMELSSFLKGH